MLKEKGKANSKEENRIFVCKGDDLSLSYRQSSQLNKVWYFNRVGIPFLKGEGMFKSHDLRDYYGLTRDNVFSNFVEKRIKGKNEFQRENIKAKSVKEFDKYMEDKIVPVFEEISEDCLKYVSFDEKREEFVVDEEAYRSEGYIYAETEAEKKVYYKLKTIVEALSELNFEGLDYRQILRITPDGKTEIAPIMSASAWRKLVDQS